MRQEIERKFLVKPQLMPNLKDITPKIYERYFLNSEPGVEEISIFTKRKLKFQH